MRLVLGLGLCVGVYFSLRPVVLRSPYWVVLVPEYGMGTFMGDLALWQRLLRLGTIAAV